MVVQINQNTWRIDEKDVRFFLLEGKDKTLLVDTGKVTDNAKEIAQSLTSKPLELLNTHADLDHIRSNYEFEWFYMNPAEACNYYKRNKGAGTLVPVENGQVIDLGDRPLEIVTLAGHTPGSICFYDEAESVLLSGDTMFCGGCGRVDFPGGDGKAMMESLGRLLTLPESTTVLPGHGCGTTIGREKRGGNYA